MVEYIVGFLSDILMFQENGMGEDMIGLPLRGSNFYRDRMNNYNIWSFSSTRKNSSRIE